jgi:prolyl oligopeptidase
MSVGASNFRSAEEIIHGMQVRDPFRWLEDRGLSETQRWIDAQRASCEAYFAGCPALPILRNRVRMLLDTETLDQPVAAGEYRFYRRREQGREQASIYVCNTTAGVERCLVEPSGWGPFASVTIHRVSDDGQMLAYEFRIGGGDAREIRVIDTRDARPVAEPIERGYPRGFAFSTYEKGFYYCQDALSLTGDLSIRYRSMLPASADRVLFSRPRTGTGRLTLIADEVQLGAVWIHSSGKDQLCDCFVAPRDNDLEWRAVFLNKPMPYYPILRNGRIFVLSHDGAPNGKVVELTVDGKEVRVTVPEAETTPRQMAVAGGRFFVNYVEGAHSVIRSWTLNGDPEEGIDVPKEGTIQILPQLIASADTFFFTHESFLQPPRIYEYAARMQTTTAFNEDAQSDEIRTCRVERVSFPSSDGTEIPLTLVALPGTSFHQNQPVIMTGYGGFGAPLTPQYSVLVNIMLELGAIFVVPHVRGGGEFGSSWHEAARGASRQTAVGDFTRAAEWLCSEGITTPQRLAIFGGSNAGLLVAAAMTGKPGLFRAVLSIAPLLDMVRYERFDQAAKWRSEYGSVANAAEFRALLSYSPYHHVRRNIDYPAVLFVTGDSDDRCNPAHVRKMAARLQERAVQHHPVLVDYSAERGHSPVLPLSVRIEALARRTAFLCRELGIQVREEEWNDVARH